MLILSRRCARLPNRLSRAISTVPLHIHPEVKQALHEKRPVVALESTVITHGVPYPTNVKLTLSMEAIVRSSGAIPATIGIIDGRVHVGLEEPQLQRLADREKYPATVKVSRRDIGPVMVNKMDGGTTCSATLIFAALAGIKVFATGGLGGVHRGGESTMDISADLFELSRCPVGLVSSGIKSILDIRRTLEYLETLGVPVLSYGPSKEFPAFFTRKSGIYVPWNVESPADAANILYTQKQLGLNNGALFAVPIPEQYEPNGASIQAAIEQAISESESLGIEGKEATPWLLSRINELTSGHSLTANIALLENSALIGAQIAVEHAKLENEQTGKTSALFTPQTTSAQKSLPPAEVLVVGSAAIDITARANQDASALLGANSTSPGAVSVSLGGVARNVAEAAHRLLHTASAMLLVSPIGHDHFGNMMLEATANIGMRSDGLIRSDSRTAVCNLLLDSNGDLSCGVADMGITEEMTSSQILAHVTAHNPRMVLMDGNLTIHTINDIVQHCVSNGIQVLFEPTSVTKSTAILPAISAMVKNGPSPTSPIACSFPNLLELAQMYKFAQEESLQLMDTAHWWETIDRCSLDSRFRNELNMLSRQPVDVQDLSKGTLEFLTSQGIAQMAVNLLPFFQTLVIKLGSKGVLVAARMPKGSPWGQVQSDLSQRCIVAQGDSEESVVIRHFPAFAGVSIVNSTGAGDSLAGSILASLMRDGRCFDTPQSLDATIHRAQRAAVMALQSQAAVSPFIAQVMQ